MPKQVRKRKHEDEDSVEIITPKNKFRPFDEKARLEEEKLSQILFGGASSFLQSLEEAEQEPIQTTSAVDSGVGETDSDESDQDRKPAWVDEEDDGIDVGQALTSQSRKLPDGGVNSRDNSYYSLLKHKFTNVVGIPSWAKLGKSRTEDSDSDNEVLQSCGFIKKTEKLQVPSGDIEFKKVKDLNCETYNEGPYINAVEFHPTSSVALVAGSSGIASLFAVDGKRNNKLHSIQFQKFPIICARFTKCGNQAILGSRHSYFYSYDLLSAKAIRTPLPAGLTNLKKFILSPDGKYIAAAGKWGEIHIISSTSKENLFTLKQDSEVTALAFNPLNNLLFAHCDTGEVTIFDVNMRRVKHKWYDDGCIQGSAIDISLSNQFVATGSAQGVVNLYEMDSVIHQKTPQPIKSIFNLTTGITDMMFNTSSEILSLCSSDIEHSIRLFHLSSKSVFKNFPSFNTKLGHINITKFSSGSGYLALANNKSTVALYRLKHFKSY